VGRNVWAPISRTERREHLLTLARFGLLLVEKARRGRVAFVLYDASPGGARHLLAPTPWP